MPKLRFGNHYIRNAEVQIHAANATTHSANVFVDLEIKSSPARVDTLRNVMILSAAKLTLWARF